MEHQKRKTTYCAAVLLLLEIRTSEFFVCFEKTQPEVQFSVPFCPYAAVMLRYLICLIYMNVKALQKRYRVAVYCYFGNLGLVCE